MTESKDVKEEKNSEQIVARGSKPLVFISHDTRDAELAEAFSKLLSSVTAGVLKSFSSSDKRGNQGIAYGVEWYPEIMKKLADASDVVALLTHHSVDRPWILYEAGVAKGKLETPLLGVAIGIPLNRANNGPFAQFQNCGDDVESLTKLVVQLVCRIPNSDPDTSIIRMQVESFKKQAEEILKNQPAAEEKSGELMEDSSVAKLFEEVKIMFQDLPQRIERNIEPGYRKRRLKFHPDIFHEMMFMSENPDETQFGFLIMISLYREDFPWVYEVGRETYDILKSNRAVSTKQKAISEFRRVIRHSLRHPMLKEMGRSKDSVMMLEELTYISERYLEQILDTTKE